MDWKGGRLLGGEFNCRLVVPFRVVEVALGVGLTIVINRG